MYARSMIFALTAASVLASTSAFADTKSYPGHACLTHNESLTRAGSKIQNTDTTSANVACPLVGDNTAVGIDSGTVWVVDQHFTDNVSCTLSVKNSDGASVAFSTESTSGTNPAVQALTFGSLVGVIVGHYTLYCTLPGVYSGQNSSIVSYSFTEL